jgi:hypothetical protein
MPFGITIKRTTVGGCGTALAFLSPLKRRLDSQYQMPHAAPLMAGEVLASKPSTSHSVFCEQRNDANGIM